MPPKSGLRIVQSTVDQEVERLETYVGRMERRYECPSSVALDAVASGRMKETAEVSRWLASYNVLMRLTGEAVPGGETGSHTNGT